MQCQWGALGVLTGFLSGAAFGTVVYRWFRGETDIVSLAGLAAIALLLGVIALLSARLAQHAA